MAVMIDIKRAHNLDPEEVRQRVQELVTRLHEQVKVHYQWEGPDLSFTRKGVRGRIHIGGTEVRIEVHLSVLHRLLKRKIEAEIHSYLDANLG